MNNLNSHNCKASILKSKPMKRIIFLFLILNACGEPTVVKNERGQTTEMWLPENTPDTFTLRIPCSTVIVEQRYVKIIKKK